MDIFSIIQCTISVIYSDRNVKAKLPLAVTIMTPPDDVENVNETFQSTSRFSLESTWTANAYLVFIIGVAKERYCSVMPFSRRDCVISLSIAAALIE